MFNGQDRPISLLERNGRPTSPHDEVVLLDERGRAAGRALKSEVHTTKTPLHLAVSCHVVRGDGRLLVTRRSGSKRTWPGVWTNACCGHPRPDESTIDAARRHLSDELGLTATRLALALPDFTYRASMANGLTEHELCPVFIAEVDEEPVLDPEEADAAEWLTWDELCARAAADAEFSPWARSQIGRLGGMTRDPLSWVRGQPQHTTSRPLARRADSSSMQPFGVFAERVDRVVEEFIATASRTLDALDPLTSELVTPIASLFAAGGKRLRPCLVFCGHEAAEPGNASRPDDTDLANLAAAVEMLHTFALLHDDVMDRSALRRGVPAAHVSLAEHHRTNRLRGDSDWFGTSAALVAGDLAFVFADQLLDRLACEAGRRDSLRSIFSTLRTEVIAGQYLDLRLAGPLANDDQALNVALLKSGRYSVTRPLQLGAVLGGASERTLDALSRYGDAVGIAFQLRDDILGVFGDPQITGKGATEDICGGKASLLLVRALELASRDEGVVLRGLLGRGPLDAAEIETCREIVRTSGARASLEALVAAKVAEADRAVDVLPAPIATRLTVIADSLVERSF